MPPNPRIRPVEVGNLTIVDPADATTEQASAATVGHSRGLKRWIREVDRPAFTADTFCSQEYQYDDGGPIERPEVPGSLDFSKPAIFMYVLRGGVGHGIFSISNMVFETNTPSKIEAVAFGVYVSNPAQGPTRMLEESARVCSHFLDNDIILKSGKILDILEWELLFDRRLRRPGVIDFVPWFRTAKRIGLAYEPLEDDDVMPRRMRRLNAPRQRPGDTTVERDPTL